MTRAYSEFSLEHVRVTPGRSHLERSDDVGWRSLLAIHSRTGDAVEAVDTVATPDQMICLATGGSGSLEYSTGGAWHRDHLRAGTAYLTGARERHSLRWRADGGSAPLEWLHIFVAERIFEEAAQHFRRPGQSAPAHAVSALAVRNGALEEVSASLLRAMRAGAPDIYAEATATWLATHLLVTPLGRSLEDDRYPGAITDPRLARAIDYIEANLGAGMSLSSIASEAGVSKYHFSRIFHGKVGSTPLQFVLERRLRHAARALTDTDDPIKQIAFRCGFTNLPHFNHAFRQRFGVTPGAYRRAGRHRPIALAGTSV